MRVMGVILVAAGLASCAVAPPGSGTHEGDAVASGAARAPDHATAWVVQSAEYAMLARQVYADALGDLPGYLADQHWTALPGYATPAGAAPAIILDVDETVLDNSQYQVQQQGVYDPATWDRWIAAGTASAVPAAAEFLAAARAAGVTAFFVTNRRCRPREDGGTACPQKSETLTNLARAGIPAEAQHLQLRDEQPGWTSEKLVRRESIAARYRVIMLFGDDLADFLPCVRGDVVPPCAEPSSQAGRRQRAEDAGRFWGAGWYLLPNPMYGSWTGVQ